MPFEDKDKEIAAIGFGIDTPFWKDFLLPKMQERARSLAESTMLQRTADEDINRGWFAALRWVISLPMQELAEYRKIEQEREQEARLANLDEHRARHGFRSPFATPGPGELTEEESNNA